MISKEAKKRADRIDKIIKIKEKEFYEQQKEVIIDVDFAHTYQFCPRCTNKLSFPLLINWCSHGTIFNCKKCKVSYNREVGMFGGFSHEIK